MAGYGKRFADCGFTIPKPLIKVGSKAMYRYALDSLPLHMASKLIFTLRKDHFLETLIDDIKSYYSSYNYKIIVLENETRGQAETVLKSSAEIDDSEPTLIHNCDTFFTPSLDWKNLIQGNIDGAMVLFPSTENRWSYAKLREDETRVIDVKEKKVISPYASTGTYFFKDSRALLANIERLIDLNIKENNEYYLSSVYQIMIAQQKSIIPFHVEKIMCFGTPQDLVDSLNAMLNQNSRKVA